MSCSNECKTLHAMRTCGACVHTDTHSSAPPSSACVVAFSRPRWGGENGIMEHVQGLAESSILPGASSYCTVCRKTTWLCNPDKNLSEAALDFWHRWKTGMDINTSMQRLSVSVRKRKRTATAHTSSHGLDEGLGD